MVRIRLSRKGKKGVPFYRIVITDMRKKRNCAPIEEIGTYNPKTKQLILNKEKAEAWIKKGAIPTDTIKALLKK